MGALDDTTTTWRWALLVLACIGPASFLSFDCRDRLGRKTLWPCEVPLLGARVAPAERIVGLAADLELHRHHQVAIRPSGFEDKTADICLMDTLHDDDDGRTIQVIETVGDGFPEPSHCVSSHDIRFGFMYVVRIVNDDAIAALTRTDAFNA